MQTVLVCCALQEVFDLINIRELDIVGNELVRVPMLPLCCLFSGNISDLFMCLWRFRAVSRITLFLLITYWLTGSPILLCSPWLLCLSD